MEQGETRARKLSGAERLELRQRVFEGESFESAAAAVGCSTKTIQRMLAQTGGLKARARPRSALRLAASEREEISRGLRAGDSVRVIAGTLRRAPSTVSREVTRNGTRSSYRAWKADYAAERRARRPKPAKLALNARLRAVVERGLEALWSPEQIAAQLASEYPDDPEMQVSHETIYRTLFVQSRGALRKELTAYLRTGRTRRRSRKHREGSGSGKLQDMVAISQRPAEAADRAVPGHWEGDLLIGRGGRSAVGTLVERSSRYVMLFPLRTGRTAHDVRIALTRVIKRLPTQLRRSLTWDQGKEMAEHVRFTTDAKMQVYFCDPHSPWQRGSNENTNGLLRQYLPRTADFSELKTAQLDAIARSLNTRPRQTLGWMTPSRVLGRSVAMTG